MNGTISQKSNDSGCHVASLKALLDNLVVPYKRGDKVGVKLHWGERGNESFLPPFYAREIIRWLKGKNTKPFVWDTSVLYSGGRRTGKDSLGTAEEHGYTADYLGCPIIMGDGEDSRDVLTVNAPFHHFNSFEVAAIIKKAEGFFIFSHFKGHIESGFAGSIKNLAMGFASRAQKQLIHADAHPVLNKNKCTKCGTCADLCPTGAVIMPAGKYPAYNLDLCTGCAQCIAMCPSIALKIFWATSESVFQEKLVEAAAAAWNIISYNSLVVNALIGITKDCDCMTGHNPLIAPDMGFIGGYHPVTVDFESIKMTGEEVFNKAHRSVPWKRQFEYASQIGFVETF